MGHGVVHCSNQAFTLLSILCHGKLTSTTTQAGGPGPPTCLIIRILSQLLSADPYSPWFSWAFCFDSPQLSFIHWREIHFQGPVWMAFSERVSVAAKRAWGGGTPVRTLLAWGLPVTLKVCPVCSLPRGKSPGVQQQVFLAKWTCGLKVKLPILPNPSKGAQAGNSMSVTVAFNRQTAERGLCPKTSISFPALN